MLNLIYSIIVFGLANSFLLLRNFDIKLPIVVLVIFFILINLFPNVFREQMQTRKLHSCRKGNNLLIIFSLSVTYSIILYLATWLTNSFILNGKKLGISIGITILVESIVFWNGIIRVYLSSKQLGVKWRIIGLLCGWIPGLNIWTLYKILRISVKEVKFENDKILLNQKRKKDQICKTKYPILFVHGVFFRDSEKFNYWGRIPKELEDNGAVCFYGNHQSAAAVSESAEELKERIEQIVKETGCEKVNIIAHSKGGLDSRYMISVLGMEKYVASLTTINTPNRGCEFADYLLSKMSAELVKGITNKYNYTLRKLGDPNPDFIAAVNDLTASKCKELNAKIVESPNVYYQSFGSKLNVARGGRFPLNLTHDFVQGFDGDNDGLVGKKSFSLGDNFEYLTVKGKRGISHGDMIDLNRENLDEFDVREFYVKLVSGLREKGF